jgi:hypothetical protein
MIYQIGQELRYLGHKWVIKSKSVLGDDFLVLRRKSFLGDLRKFGQVATEIDASIKDLNRLAV